MDTDRHLIARVRAVDPQVVDSVLAVLLTLGVLAGAPPHPELDALAVVFLIAFTSSVAWRGRDPVLATLVAITGLIAFRLSSGNDGYGFAELTVIPLNFYMLGRRSRGRENAVAFTLVFAYWLAADVVVTLQPSWRFGGRRARDMGAVWRFAVRRWAHADCSQQFDARA